MFIGIAVSYGLFGRRNVDRGNLDASQSYVSGMFHASSIFEDGFDHSMYYSGQGKGGFFNVKNGSFENPYEENVVQAWNSKYFQREPMVVLAQPHGGSENYDESGLFTDYKPLGLPVRSLKTGVRTRGSAEFGNGSSDSSGSSANDWLDSSDKSRSGRFGASDSENLEAKFNENTVLGSPIPWRSRSGRMIKERVGGGATRPSHFRPLSVDETQFESLKSRSLRSTVSFSSQVSSQSHSPSSLSPSHSNSSELPKLKTSELTKESDILGSPIPWRSRTGRMIEETVCGSATRPPFVDETQFESLKSRSLQSTVSFSSQVSSKSHSPSSMSPTHSNSSESPKSKMSELAKESDILGSPIPWQSRSGRMIEETVCSSASRPSHFRPLSVDGTQFESLKSRSLRSTVSFSSQVSSQSHSPSSMSPSHSNSSESPKSKMSELAKERSPRWSLPPTSPSISKPVSSKTASHSRQCSDGSLLGTRARKCFEDELKEYYDSQKGDSSSSKDWILGYLKSEAKPAAPSKASSRGKSVRTFRSFSASGNNIREKEAGEEHENRTKGNLTMGSDEVEEAYSGESKQKIVGHNNLSDGFNRQNLGGECYMPKPTSPENQIRERRKHSENSAVESGEDPERENKDFQVSSDEETMSGTFSVAGSDTFEVDRKAGEFIAKFKEQIRHQRTTSIDTTSIDTPRGLNITGNFFW
ncbi:hypothetical protein DITRI_Ditri13aG0014800 [Diplodiscus trichospermus]